LSVKWDYTDIQSPCEVLMSEYMQKCFFKRKCAFQVCIVVEPSAQGVH
jgi:hypothetical protein